jgi:predicted O-linked N-acetylglucosamine transferase (SPINDLY family)
VLKRYDEALAAFDRALALKPDLAEAWLGRGNVFVWLKRYEEALAAFDRALALKPDFPEAWNSRGILLIELKRYHEAIDACDKALALNPNLDGIEGLRLRCKTNLCDWTDFTDECEHLNSSLKNGKGSTDPFSFLGISASPEHQRKCAELWVAKKYPSFDKSTWRGEVYKHDRIRIAYVSADFHQHAVSYLIAGMFECHDRSQFEVMAISFGPDDASEMRQRLRNSFEHFIDGKAYDDDEIASQIKNAEIDILIDLKGFTNDARTGIFARRPAPIQVNYLGYPGTMGADYIDYIIADGTLIPDSYQAHYTEKIVYLPNSYQANDKKRPISDKVFTRLELELPENGIIFCCFNDNYKILPDIFDRWMQILLQIEGSVLWLLVDNASAASNLRKEAEARGVSGERLVFAGRMPLPDHLARYRLADLFLDTLPYNAHTTASDALWAGLPVLTQIGETFAGRVSGSLLTAIGLPELITSTPQAYEHRAIELAINPEKLAAIKHRLANNRITTSLFDTQLYARHIEAAYRAMYERYQANVQPDHIHVRQQGLE